MKNFFKKNFITLIVVGTILLSFILVLFTFSIISNFNANVEENITDKAEVMTYETNEILASILNECEGNTIYLAGYLKEYTDEKGFMTAIRAAEQDTRLGRYKCIRYCKDGQLYDDTCAVSQYAEYYEDLVAAATTGDSSGVYGSVYDYEFNMNLVAFYASVENNPNIDSVILYYNETIFSDDYFADVENITNSEFVVLCTNTGRVMLTLYPEYEAESFITVGQNSDILSVLKSSAMDSSATDSLSSMITGTEDGVLSAVVNGERYAFSIKHTDICDSLITVALFRAYNLDSSSNSDMSSIASTLVLLLIGFFILIIVVFVFRRTTEKNEKKAKSYDDNLNVLNLKGFEDIVKNTIASYGGSNFAVVVADLKHYNYLSERFPDKLPNIMKRIRDTINSSLELGEQMGSAGEGKFVMLLHYKDTTALRERVKRLSAVISKIGTKEYNVRLDFGIAEITGDRARLDIHRFTANALEAAEADKSSKDISNINFFNKVFKENYMESAEIELKMEFALKNDEFKVFFQPKINGAKDRMHSCEALVRWYDAEKEYYRTPDMFLPLFEQNGFIIRLDKYVFYKACEFIGLRISQDQPICPVSVNISRATAMSPGFIEYYVKIKTQFKIPDGYLIMEFTESMASASYEQLNTISNLLHQNGFLCSIDDFGSGYSSFNMLKNVNIDEIKMDRMFLNPGINAERDHVIILSVVQLARELGISVVQEGVETAEQLQSVLDDGCEIIQGYYYSKPLHMLDFIKFLDARAMKEELRYNHKGV